MPYAPSLATLLAALGLAGCPHAPAPPASPGPAVRAAAAPPAAQAELLRRASYLADDACEGRDEGSPGGLRARAFLEDELGACGITPLGAGGFAVPIPGGRGANLLGVVRGTDPTLADRHVLLGAHYDHIGQCGGAICNGADDNAAAVAITLDVACALAASPPRRSVVVALFDAEEPPTYQTATMGSVAFAADPEVPLDRLDAALVLDLVGSDLWPGYPGHFVLGEELSPALSAALDAVDVPPGLDVVRMGLHLVEETPFGSIAWSDYDAFRDRGVPVLFFSNGQNKRYHTPEDEVRFLNLPKMLLEVKHLGAVTRRLADAEVTPVFDARGASPARDAAGVARVIAAAERAETGVVARLGLSSETGDVIARDRAAVAAVGARVAAGQAPSAADIAALRRATQRIVCLAGPRFSEAQCGQL